MSGRHSARPRRSCLYMPGSNSRALDKARSLPADVVIMDLEDAVAPEAKALAREQVMAAIEAGGHGSREVWVRINALSSDWGEADLRMVAQVQPAAVLVPKVSDPDDVLSVNERLRSANIKGELAIWAMIETPKALLELQAIARSQERTRLAGFMIGTNDLAKDLGLENNADRTPLLPIISQIVVAARAYGLEVIDGVWNDIADSEGLERECLQGRQFGCDGKSLIHPSQIATANTVFAPNPEAVARAYRIREAFAQPENAGKGVIKVDGQMTERLHLEMAQRLIARSELLATLADHS